MATILEMKDIYNNIESLLGESNKDIITNAKKQIIKLERLNKLKRIAKFS